MFMKGRLMRWAMAGTVLCGLTAAARADTVQRVGLGVGYWTKVGSIDYKPVDTEGLTWLLSYQAKVAPLVKLELDAEFLPDKFGGASRKVIAPEAFVVVGYGLYAAAGIGIYYNTEDGFADNPFYALRVGLDFPVLPYLHADLSVSYHFEHWKELDGFDINKDTLEAGAALRLEL
jgi:hypothetical protein